MKWISLYILCFVCCQIGFSQADSMMLDKDFKFLDGVYLSVEDFKANQPVYLWEEIEAQVVTSPSSLEAQADYIRKPNGELLTNEEIWGISLNGMPYISLKNTNQTGLKFAGLKVRGKLCMFSYETKETEWVEIAAYNPLTGRPFRKGKVSKEVTKENKYILDFVSGAVLPFDRQSLLQFIVDDEKLWRTVEELEEDASDKKLYKCLLIYDDRNPVYLPVRKQN
jgi:hypothetical protein